ncbi:MAG: hypothetical protein ACYDCM_08960 [Candidatus Acidiferrales bacterium]
MIDESGLRDALISLTTMMRNQYQLLTSSMIELSALRASVRGLDPSFEDILAMKRQEALQSTRQAQTALTAIFDDLIRRLESGEIC